MADDPLIVTEWEVEEFIEQVALRPKLWVGKGKLWVRKHEGANYLAVKFVNGLPEDMSTMHVVALGGQTGEEAWRYGTWLLKKFTSYEERRRIERLIFERFVRDGMVIPVGMVEDMARAICMPVERIFTVQVLAPVPTPIRHVSPIQPIAPPITPPAVTTPIVETLKAKPPPVLLEPKAESGTKVRKKRETYLERLLRDKSSKG